jgi:hypothetical protein
MFKFCGLPKIYALYEEYVDVPTFQSDKYERGVVLVSFLVLTQRGAPQEVDSSSSSHASIMKGLL